LSTYVGDYFSHQDADEAMKGLQQIAAGANQAQAALQPIATQMGKVTVQVVDWHSLKSANVPAAVTSNLPSGTTIDSLQAMAKIPTDWHQLTDANIPETIH
ncbi:ABC transporter ATP-binding protein, partial [Lactococcus garvieae]|nr:ABC transporter ATP-binding protein [Lactococcus garvieae]